MTCRAEKYQAGNILFLILIAVALFAALSYAVTKSTSGGGDADRETVALEAAGIAQYISVIQQAILRLQVMNGCAADEISFEASNWGHTDYDYAPASRTECRVFHSDGGGVSFQPLDAKVLDSTHNAITGYGNYWYGGNLNINGKGAFVAELTMTAAYIQKDVCEELSKQFDQGDTAATYGANWSVSTSGSVFNGDYNSGHVFGSSAWGNAHCMNTGTGLGGQYMFYIILISR